ncbi:autotransporter assembly complex family protein [Lutimaribacter marinistellae]|uniref:Autotransporter assembly complex family protein n=1 Tax=Lutimaribacter marinistellae TaxID=1820329 RepID=A0ABV7TFB9_9RHOB
MRGLCIGCAVIFPGVAVALETVLNVSGGSPNLRDRIEQSSSVLNAEERGLDAPLELLSAAQADYRTIVQILYDEGHFGPVVNIRLDGREAARVNPLSPPSAVQRVEVIVEAGPAFRFGQAVITPVAPGTELPEEFVTGGVANTGIIRDTVSEGLTSWRELGHPKAELGNQNIRARHAQALLDAEIRLAPGPQLAFGDLRISGPTAVSERAIRKIAGFPTGEIYSPDDLQKSGSRLRRTGAFQSVSFQEAEVPNPDGTLDYTLTLEDMPQRRITFGAEISSREGIDLTVAWMHRNLFGNAERFRFEASLRNIGGDEDLDGRIGLRLDEPARFGPDDSAFWIAQIERQNRLHYNLLQADVGYGTRRTFSDTFFAEAWAGFSYSDADDAYGTDRKFRYLLIAARTELDERDSSVSATSGYYLNAELTPFAGLGDADSGLRAFVDGRAYWTPGVEGRVTLAGRMQIGSVMGPSASGVTPGFLFFSGGAGTVRGQPYESLGIPVGANTAGGKSFLGVSAEVRGQVTERIQVVGFYDWGAVDDSAFISTGAESHAGAGLGVRYGLGGFGPLRLDLAYPVQGDTGDGLQFYIGIGQAF